MVMPLLEGETLASRLMREGPLSLDEALELLLPVIAAVAAAHRRRVVHRDLKPDNVFLAHQGGTTTVKVLDFGIAKLALEDPNDQGTLTGTGVLLGTPCYMAPEQAFGERDLDQRVDIWALGAMFYETLSGARPIEGENIGQVVRNLMTQGITPLHVIAVDVPEAVREMVMCMLARDRDARPATLDQVYSLLCGFAPEANRAALAAQWARDLASNAEQEEEANEQIESEEEVIAYAPTESADTGRPETALTATVVSASPPSSSGRKRLALALGLAAGAGAAGFWLIRPSAPELAEPPPPSKPAQARAAVEPPAAPAVSLPAPSAESEAAPSAAPHASSPVRERPALVKQAKPQIAKPEASAKAVVVPAPGLQEEPPF
jgi:serine/threonine-protein kinase